MELRFDVDDPDEPPRVTWEVLEGELRYSTRVRVDFDDPRSPRRCARSAARYLRYVPCQVSIDGESAPSIWDRAREKGARVFASGPVRGFLERRRSPEVSVLCKYEHVIDCRMTTFLTGGHGAHHDLRDFQEASFPFLPGVGVSVNADNLRVTISRDSYYLDHRARHLVATTRDAMLEELRAKLASSRGELEREERDLVAANLVALARPLRRYLGRHVQHLRGGAALEEGVYEACRALAEARVFQVAGRAEPVSLLYLARLKDPALPLYVSAGGENLDWLGGVFRHDFLVVPPRYRRPGAFPGMWRETLDVLFGDVVDLESIHEDRQAQAELVARGLVDGELLDPEVRVVGELEVSSSARRLLEEIGAILGAPRVRGALSEALGHDIRCIEAVYFSVDRGCARVSSALLDGGGKLLSAGADDGRYVLGLCTDSALVSRILASSDPHRAYYALTYLVGQLPACQARLTPGTKLFDLVRDSVATGLRRALVEHMMRENDAD